MSGQDSNIQPARRSFPKMLPKAEQERSRVMPASEHEVYGLKRDIEEGCARFWAKRGGDPNKLRCYNYGKQKGHAEGYYGGTR